MENNKPSVLIGIDYYFPGNKSGGPKHTISNIIYHLAKEINFKIITRDRDLADKAPYPDIVSGLWLEKFNTVIKYLSPDSLVLFSIRRAILESKYDLLYINSVFSSPFSIKPLLLRKFGLIPSTPVIVAPRGEFSAGAIALKKLKKMLFLFFAKTLNLYNGVIWQASSKYEAEDIYNRIGKKARVYVAPDLAPKINSDSTILRYRRKKESGTLNIVFLSRISHMKNLDGAINILRGTSGKVFFNIYGPIEDKKYWSFCQELIRILPPNVQVKYHGEVPHENIIEILSTHDLLFLPSHGENFGHVILESLISGCPVLISDQTPWRGLEDKGVGWDLPLNRPDLFRDVLQKCVEMDEKSLQALALRATKYGIEKSADRDSIEQNRKLFYDAYQCCKLKNSEKLNLRNLEQ